MSKTPFIPPELRMAGSEVLSSSLPQTETARLSLPSLGQSFLNGSISTTIGRVPRVLSQLSSSDRVGSWKARWGFGRMRYKVGPGLYALGDPTAESPVFVTANYKMSFDRLRSALPGRSAWILVLDTQGINVWCAAGKGTFGTRELVRRIAESRLPDVVSHKNLILPQLGAPGIAAHLVKRASGFKVIYGPIRAEDLPSFLDAGMKASPAMRTKTFPFRERLVLIPIELVIALKTVAIIIPALFILSGILGKGEFWAGAMSRLIYVPALLAAIFAGAVVTPLLLPWLPGRAFALKGLVPGLVLSAFLVAMSGAGMDTAGWTILIPALSTYLAMNFTGASTYTSLSGVRKEMRWAVPIQVVAGVIGIGLWIGSLLS